jgi:hypothetical protein
MYKAIKIQYFCYFLGGSHKEEKSHFDDSFIEFTTSNYSNQHDHSSTRSYANDL